MEKVEKKLQEGQKLHEIKRIKSLLKNDPRKRQFSLFEPLDATIFTKISLDLAQIKFYTADWQILDILGF